MSCWATRMRRGPATTSARCASRRRSASTATAPGRKDSRRWRAATPEAAGEWRRFHERMREFKALRGKDGRRAFAIPLAFSSRDAALRSLDRLTMHDWLRGEGFASEAVHWLVNYACRDDYGCEPPGGVRLGGNPLLREPGCGRARCRPGHRAHLARGQRLRRAKPRAAICPERDARHARPPRRGRRARRHAPRLCRGREPLRGDPRRARDLGRALRLCGARACRCRRAARRRPAFLRIRALAHGEPDAFRAAARAPRRAALLGQRHLRQRLPRLRGRHAPGCRDTAGPDRPHVVPAALGARPRRPAGSACSPPRDGTGRRRRWRTWKSRIRRSARSRSAWTSSPTAMRWCRPRPGLVWGEARARILGHRGRLHFAHADASGISIFEEANDRGVAAAEAVLAALGERVASVRWQG